jgi:hypothetical protein
MKYLKINFIITLAILIGSFNAYAQTTNATKARIDEIKKWYGEIQTIGLKNCKTKKNVKTEGTDRWSFDLNIQVCELNNLYQVTKCQFDYTDGDKELIIYRKNSKIFFVFIKGTNERFNYEQRYYCNQDEKTIQQLDREGVDLQKVNSTQNKENLYKNIKVVLAEEFAEIERAFN